MSGIISSLDFNSMTVTPEGAPGYDPQERIYYLPITFSSSGESTTANIVHEKAPVPKPHIEPRHQPVIISNNEDEEEEGTATAPKRKPGRPAGPKTKRARTEEISEEHPEDSSSL
ncbi:hypothetical protein EC968_008238 [Mortierella alpina]|nr:hypothetical protein EC968_008238 [Mortierella alpina]